MFLFFLSSYTCVYPSNLALIHFPRFAVHAGMKRAFYLADLCLLLTHTCWYHFPTFHFHSLILVSSCFCCKCLQPDVVLSVLEDDGKAYLTEGDYQRISTVLLYYIINLQDLCVSNAASPSSLSSSTSSFGNYQFYLLALTNLHPDEDSRFLSSSETESILQLINQHYHPFNQDISSGLQVRIFFFFF